MGAANPWGSQVRSLPRVRDVIENHVIAVYQTTMAGGAWLVKVALLFGRHGHI
jgi:hypothetical protein